VEPDASVEQGVLPKLLANLVQRRREVKNLIKGERDPAKLSEYDIRQRALKLTANRCARARVQILLYALFFKSKHVWL
jgi:hypothetical protein